MYHPLKLICLFLIAALSSRSCEADNHLQFGTLDVVAFRQLIQQLGISETSELLQNSEYSFIVQLIFPKIPTILAKNISHQCHQDSVLYLQSLLNLTDWALKMYDSSAVSAPGYFSGNAHAMGHFDQCLSVKGEQFQGKYCTGFYTLLSQPTNSTSSFQRSLLTILQILGYTVGEQLEEPLIIPVEYSYIFKVLSSVAFCIPSTCTGMDIQNAFTKLIGSYSLTYSNTTLAVATYAGDEYCYIENFNTPKFATRDIAMLGVLGLIGLVIVMATCYEVYREAVILKPVDLVNESVLVKAFLCFSFVNNSRKLMSVGTTEGSLACIHGVRFLSMTWVVLGHSWSRLNNGNNMNTAGIMSRIHEWPLQTILNASVSVDTFFLLSGLLASYLLLKQLDKLKGKFNPLLLYLHRFLRLTPTYAIILGFNATLIVYLAIGPFWYNNIQFVAEGCQKVWWQQLLYINNLVYRNMNEQCMPETWYIAVDMQLFLISPILVYPLWRWTKWGLVWLGSVILGSLCANVAFFWTEDVIPTIIATRTDGDIMALSDHYQKPWYRAPPYLVGIFVGWALHITKQKKLRTPRVVNCCVWLLAAAVASAVLYGITVYADQKVAIPKPVTILYGSFHRFAWSAAVGWMIFASIQGNGGYFNDFLSWKFFVPVSRLTYCMYLTHLNLLNVFVAQQRSPFYYTALDNVYAYFGNLLASIGLSFIVAVAIETPFLSLEKLFLRY